MDTRNAGEKIRHARKIKGITQEQLASLTGLSTMSIRRYEGGERIVTDDTIQRVAEALRIPAPQILGEPSWLSDNLRFYRKIAGITQKKVSEETEIPISTIRAYESGSGGRFIPESDLQTLATFFSVDPKTLLGHSATYENMMQAYQENIAADQEETARAPEDEQRQQVINYVMEKLKEAGPFRKISTEESHRLGILNVTFNSEEDKIAYFYSLLNTDGKLAASKCFYQHLDKERIGEVADYVEKLSEIPQYQCPTAPQSPPAPTEDTDTLPSLDDSERPHKSKKGE